jgi:hypothetical protein
MFAPSQVPKVTPTRTNSSCRLGHLRIVTRNHIVIRKSVMTATRARTMFNAKRFWAPSVISWVFIARANASKDVLRDTTKLFGEVLNNAETGKSEVPRQMDGNSPRRACQPGISRALIHEGGRFGQRKRGDLDIKFLASLIDHLVGAVHCAKRSCERAA